VDRRAEISEKNPPGESYKSEARREIVAKQERNVKRTGRRTINEKTRGQRGSARPGVLGTIQVVERPQGMVRQAYLE